MHPGEAIVELDRVTVRVEVDGRDVRIRMVPGGMDDDAVDINVGLAVPG